MCMQWVRSSTWLGNYTMVAGVSDGQQSDTHSPTHDEERGTGVAGVSVYGGVMVSIIPRGLYFPISLFTLVSESAFFSIKTAFCAAVIWTVSLFLAGDMHSLSTIDR